MRLKNAALVLIVAFWGLTGVVTGQNATADWPQWRGPNRDGTLAGFVEPRAWPERLKERWKIDVFFDLYNLFNSNATQAATTTSGSSFLRPTTITGPRMAGFGAKLDF